MNIDVLNYNDYRTFLSDYLAFRRAKSPRFTVRQFCVRAGISTDNYLLRILRGQRNLGPMIAERFLPQLGLGRVGEQYFLALVHAAAARTLSEKEQYGAH